MNINKFSSTNNFTNNFTSTNNTFNLTTTKKINKDNSNNSNKNRNTSISKIKTIKLYIKLPSKLASFNLLNSKHFSNPKQANLKSNNNYTILMHSIILSCSQPNLISYIQLVFTA